MTSLIRRQTDLNEVEHNPFRHKYLLKKPRTHESSPLSRSTSELQFEEGEQGIDNPVREKRTGRNRI